MQTPRYICSFPKSGRTWVRYCFAHYFKMLINEELPVEFKQLGRMFSDVGRESRAGQFEVLPNIIFSHEPYFREMDGCKSIMLIRHPVELLVSYFHHLSYDLQYDPKAVYPEIIERLYLDYTRYMNNWSEHLDDMHIVCYRDLFVIDTWIEMLNFLELQVEIGKLQAAFDRTNFQNMSADESAAPINESADPNHRRVRKGKLDGWKDDLTLVQAEVIMQAVKSNLVPRMWQLLEQHDLVAIK